MSSCDNNAFISILDEWKELEKEYLELEKDHRMYTEKVLEVKNHQKQCVAGIAHQRYRIKQITESMKQPNVMSGTSDTEYNEFQKRITERKNAFREMEDNLPHKNGIYLSIILGQVNVSLLSKEDRYAYKHDYERFKLVVTVITMIFAVFLFIFNYYRWMDAAFHFLLVWYYCTMTIREQILIVNGSRIKGWWLTHHFISTVCAGILLIWPDGTTYQLFRQQFMLFSFYLCLVQIIQTRYQKGCLYRLRSLGERHNMDITVEGFHSWMWRGLSFVLPFLLGAYAFQFYNSYTLLTLSYHPQCTEWQVPVLFVIFSILLAGNILTTSEVIRQKLKIDGIPYFRLQNKYRFKNNAKSL